MTPIGGFNSFAAMTVIDGTMARDKELLANEPINARAIEAFEERIGDIQTVEQLIEDDEVYRFVMRAFDLEDQIFGKGLIKKLLSEDPEENTRALANILIDNRFRELYDGLGFTELGTKNDNTISPEWRSSIVERFIDTQYVNEIGLQSVTAETALKAREKLPEVENWFQVLGDPQMTQFMQIALGLPSSISGLDIDEQVKRIEEKFDIEKLSDPDELERLERIYLAVSDANDTSRIGSNAAVQIMQATQSLINGGVFLPQLIDVSAVASVPNFPYR